MCLYTLRTDQALHCQSKAKLALSSSGPGSVFAKMNCPVLACHMHCAQTYSNRHHHHRDHHHVSIVAVIVTMVIPVVIIVIVVGLMIVTLLSDRLSTLAL